MQSQTSKHYQEITLNFSSASSVTGPEEETVLGKELLELPEDHVPQVLLTLCSVFSTQSGQNRQNIKETMYV